MIDDSQTDVVYVSDLLERKFPGEFDALKAILKDAMKIIPGTKDVWCRDYMPVQIDGDRFVQFRYNPSYLKDNSNLRTENAGKLLGLDCIQSDLVIDGGNVVRSKSTVIMTDRIYLENEGIDESELCAALQKILEVNRLIIIPTEPEDEVGHADGVVRFLDEHTVLLSDYSRLEREYGERVKAMLDENGFEIVPLPWNPTDEPGPDPEIPQAQGVYINYLQTSQYIFCPQFGLPDDDKAFQILRECFPRLEPIRVNCVELAKEGGVLNCATWNIQSMV